MSPGELASLLAILVVVASAAVSVAIYLERRFGHLESGLKEVQSGVKEVQSVVNVLVSIHQREISQIYGQGAGGPSNPHPAEKDVLLQRLQDRTITNDEAQRLRAILQEERTAAEARGDNRARLAIIAMLALIEAIIALQPQKR